MPRPCHPFGVKFMSVCKFLQPECSVEVFLVITGVICFWGFSLEWAFTISSPRMLFSMPISAVKVRNMNCTIWILKSFLKDICNGGSSLVLNGIFIKVHSRGMRSHPLSYPEYSENNIEHKNTI